jgi:hypothetical protein
MTKQTENDASKLLIFVVVMAILIGVGMAYIPEQYGTMFSDAYREISNMCWENRPLCY